MVAAAARSLAFVKARMKSPFVWMAGLAAILLGGLASQILDLGFVSGTVTDYTLYCSAPGKPQCEGNWYKGIPTTFTVNKDQQSVISKQPSRPPTLLFSCAVIDRQNWTCNKEANGRFQVGFAEGKYREVLGFDNSGSVRHVDRSEWLASPDPPPQYAKYITGR